MTRKIIGSLNISPQSAEPSSPNEGDLFYDSDDSLLKINDGSNFLKVVNLDSSDRLPAVDGSQLTNLPSGGGGTGIAEVYTGADFDVRYSGTGTDSLANTHTLQITAGNLTGDYVKIEVTAHLDGVWGSSATVTGDLQIQTAEISGGFTTRFDDNYFKSDTTFSGLGGNQEFANTIVYLHELTAGEKANGIDIKFNTTAVAAGTGGKVIGITNIQTVLYTL